MPTVPPSGKRRQTNAAWISPEIRILEMRWFWWQCREDDRPKTLTPTLPIWLEIRTETLKSPRHCVVAGSSSLPPGRGRPGSVGQVKHSGSGSLLPWLIRLPSTSHPCASEFFSSSISKAQATQVRWKPAKESSGQRKARESAIGFWGSYWWRGNGRNHQAWLIKTLLHGIHLRI